MWYHIVMNYHSLFFTLGALVTTVIYRRLVMHDLKNLVPWYRVLEDVLIVFLAGLLGARWAFALLNPSQIVSFVDYSAFWRPGLVSYGGIIVGLAVLTLLLARRPKGQVWWEAFIIATVFGWAVGRIGNFLQRDAYGVLDPAFAWSYGRVPIQLYEMVALLVLGVTAYRWWMSEKMRGWVMWFIISGYGLIRLGVDNWRDLPKVALTMNSSQIMGVGLIIYGIIGLRLWKRKRPR